MLNEIQCTLKKRWKRIKKDKIPNFESKPRERRGLRKNKIPKTFWTKSNFAEKEMKKD